MENFKNLPLELVRHILSFKPPETLHDYAESCERTKCLKVKVEPIDKFPRTIKYASMRFKYKITLTFRGKENTKSKRFIMYASSGSPNAYRTYYDALHSLWTDLTFFPNYTYEEYCNQFDTDIYDSHGFDRWVKIRQYIKKQRNKLEGILGEKEMERFMGLIDD